MEITKFVELEDGGAQFELSLTEEETKMLINYAINHMLREYVKDNPITEEDQKGKE